MTDSLLFISSAMVYTLVMVFELSVFCQQATDRQHLADANS